MMKPESGDGLGGPAVKGRILPLSCGSDQPESAGDAITA
jgi:hypothetical protein